jgi:hypothetical protein
LIDKDLACVLWQIGAYSLGQRETPADTIPMLLMLFDVPSREMAMQYRDHRATLVGNGGSAEVDVEWAPKSVAITESTLSGSRHELTLLSAYDKNNSMSLLEYLATYTRHTIPLELPSDPVSRQPIISQYRGKCVPWSIATGRFPDGKDLWPSLPPVLKNR